MRLRSRIAQNSRLLPMATNASRRLRDLADFDCRRRCPNLLPRSGRRAELHRWSRCRAAREWGAIDHRNAAPYGAVGSLPRGSVRRCGNWSGFISVPTRWLFRRGTRRAAARPACHVSGGVHLLALVTTALRGKCLATCPKPDPLATRISWLDGVRCRMAGQLRREDPLMSSIPLRKAAARHV